MFATEKLRNRRFDYRFLGLLAVLMVYIFLVGGRFSPFYRYGSFFIVPFAAVVALDRISGRAGWKSLFADRRILTAGLALSSLAGCLIAFALFSSLTKVRGFEGGAAETAFIERLVVQPTELGWASYERIFVNGEWSARRTYDFLFDRPIAAGRNTTPQYLMSQTIGEPRTSEHVLAGFQFAGGFPEIFFELFGPFWAWIFILGAGWLCACLTGILVRSIIAEQFVTTIFVFQVLFGLYVMYIGGMVNSFFAPTYWLKSVLLLAALIAETSLQRSGRSLLPWVLLGPAQIRWIQRRTHSFRSLIVRRDSDAP